LLGNEHVRSVASFQDRAKDKIFGLIRREILKTVDGSIDFPVDQRLLELFREESPFNGTGKAQIKTPVSGRPDNSDVDSQPGMGRAEVFHDDPRLSQREIAAARSKGDVIHKFYEFSRTCPEEVLAPYLGIKLMVTA
jgi:hypothetical protein